MEGVESEYGFVGAEVCVRDSWGIPGSSLEGGCRAWGLLQGAISYVQGLRFCSKKERKSETNCNLGGSRGAPWGLLGAAWEFLGSPRGVLGCVWGLGGAPGNSWWLLGSSWVVPGAPWVLLDDSWKFLGRLL